MSSESWNRNPANGSNQRFNLHQVSENSKLETRLFEYHYMDLLRDRDKIILFSILEKSSSRSLRRRE